MTKFKVIKHSKDAIRIALGGGIRNLESAFIWRESPQGSFHWGEICHGRRKMSKRSRRYLNKLLNESK